MTKKYVLKGGIEKNVYREKEDDDFYYRDKDDKYDDSDEEEINYKDYFKSGLKIINESLPDIGLGSKLSFYSSDNNTNQPNLFEKTTNNFSGFNQEKKKQVLNNKPNNYQINPKERLDYINKKNDKYLNQNNEIKMQNRANILYDSMKEKDNKNKVLLGELSKDVYQKPNKSNFSDFLSNIITQPQVPQYNVTQNSLKNQIAVDHIDNKFLKRYASENFGTETAENLLMSKKDTYLNTDYAKEHLIFNNYKELSPDLKNYFKEKIISQIGKEKLDSTKGIYIDAEHQSSKDLAKALADNREFIKKVAENRKSLKFGKSFDTSIQFTDNNFYYAIGKADIKNMHINKNGNLDLLVTDVYDFNDNKNASDLIKVGRNRQEKGEIIPYFYIYHVIIPKSAKLGESNKK